MKRPFPVFGFRFSAKGQKIFLPSGEPTCQAARLTALNPTGSGEVPII
jgi:hypothetical protein